MADNNGAFAAKFIAEPGKKFELKKRDPRDDSAFGDKDKAKARLADDAAAIDALQNRMYAENKQALLVVMQGIDCAGKDGTIRAVFNTCGPIGVGVTPFKAPTPEELAHDFLWRAHKVCPQRGMIEIFNRSHYEDILIAKVKNFAPADALERRYDEINQFEQIISENGTRILKFMLNVSKDEQAVRLRDRVDDPEKRWKFNPGDLEDRKLWDGFMAAYEAMVNRCSTKHAPWYVIPADRNWVRNCAVARIVRETLEEMNPQFPAPTNWDPKTIEIV